MRLGCNKAATLWFAKRRPPPTCEPIGKKRGEGNRSNSPRSSLRFGRRIRQTSNRSCTTLLAANSNGLLHLVKKDLAVTDLSAGGIGDDRIHCRFNDVVLENNFDLDLGK